MPTLLVFNKLDSYRYDKTEEFENFDLHLHSINERYSKKNVKVVFTSAKTKENYDELKRELYEFVSEKHYTIFPHFLRQDYVG